MFKKNALKFLILPIIAAFVIPFVSFAKTDVKAATAIYVPRSVEFVYDVENEALSALDSSEVSVKIAGQVVVNNGEKAETIPQAVDSVSYSSGTLTCKITSNGAYDVVIYKTAGDTISESVTVNVTTTLSELSKIKYATSDDYADYKSKVAAAAKDDEGNSLKVGDEYKVPSLKDVVKISNLGYDSQAVEKTVHYASNNSTYYATTTSSSFSISSVGTYKFYVTFKTDELISGENDSALSLTADYLVEKSDGFYMAKDGLGNQVFASKQDDGSYVYYKTDELDEELTETEAAAVTTDELVIPVFQFGIASSAPSIKSDSTYQEKGYIDYVYNDVSFTTKGSDYTVTYVLEYSSDNGSTWNKAEEELSSSLSFTPTKKGLYRVVATVIDCEGSSAEARTQNIEVADKYVTVQFKASFSDWLSVNTVPFVFLCISAACLIGIILIIFIKPKDESKKAKANEEDR